MMSQPRSRSPLYSRNSSLPGRQEAGCYDEQYSPVNSEPWRNPEHFNNLEGNSIWENGPSQGEQEVDHWAKFIEAIGHAGRGRSPPTSRYHTQEDVQRSEQRSSHSPRRLPRERLSSPEASHYSSENHRRIASPGQRRKQQNILHFDGQSSNRAHSDSREIQGKRRDRMGHEYYNEEHEDRHHERSSERSIKPNFREHHPHPKRFRGLDQEKEYRVLNRGYSPHNAPVVVEHGHGIPNNDVPNRDQPRSHDPYRNQEHPGGRDPPRNHDPHRTQEPSRNRYLQRIHDPLRNQEHLKQKDYLRSHKPLKNQEHPKHGDHLRTHDPLRNQEHSKYRDHSRSHDPLRNREQSRSRDLQRSYDPLGNQDHSRNRDPSRTIVSAENRDYQRSSEQSYGRKPSGSRESSRHGGYGSSVDDLAGEKNRFHHRSSVERDHVMQGRSHEREQFRMEPHAREHHGQGTMHQTSSLGLRNDMGNQARTTGSIWEEGTQDFPGGNHGVLKQGQGFKEIQHRKPNAARLDFTKHESLKIIVDMSRPVGHSSHLDYSSERQLSLDLVNVGRQRLDFLPMLEHSGTFRESSMHSGTFAQEIITLVHHVKECYFQGQGITLNERFSSEQHCSPEDEDEFDDELELEEMEPVINRPIGSSSDTQIFCNLGSWQPNRRHAPAPGDLRHDLERRRQQRLQGVKITIAGGNFSKMSSQNLASEPVYVDEEDVCASDDHLNWSEQVPQQSEQWDSPSFNDRQNFYQVHNTQCPPRRRRNLRDFSSNMEVDYCPNDKTTEYTILVLDTHGNRPSPLTPPYSENIYPTEHTQEKWFL